MAETANRLASEKDHPATARSLGALLALVAVLVVGVNQVAIRMSPLRERTFDGRTVAVKWDLATQGAPANGVIVVGDSSGNFAVSTATLEAALGRPVRNYCTYGRFLTLGAGWILDRAIEQADAPPSLALVVLGSRTHALQPDGFAFAQIPTAIGSWRHRVPRTPLTFVETGQFLISRFFPLYAQHRSFELAIRKGRWAIDPSRLPIEPNGTSVLPRAYPDGVAPFAEKVVGEMVAFEGPVPSMRERRAMEGLVRDAEERGYDLVFVDGPIWSGLEARDEHVGFLDRVHAYIDELCATSDRAWHLPGGLQTFEPVEMENPFHLTSGAAERYTAELARRLGSLGLPR